MQQYSGEKNASPKEPLNYPEKLKLVAKLIPWKITSFWTNFALIRLKTIWLNNGFTYLNETTDCIKILHKICSVWAMTIEPREEYAIVNQLQSNVNVAWIKNSFNFYPKKLAHYSNVRRVFINLQIGRTLIFKIFCFAMFRRGTWWMIIRTIGFHCFYKFQGSILTMEL